MKLRAFFTRVKRLAASVSPKKWGYICAGLFLVVLLLVVFTSKGESDPMASAEINAVIDQGALYAGVRDDIPSFGTLNENRENAGLEVDLVKLLSTEIFGYESVDFTTVNFNTLLARLKNKSLDVAAAIYQKGLSSSLVYSDPYYTDAIALMVKKDSGYTTTDQLKDKTIGCINRDGSNMRYAARNAALEFVGTAGKVVEYSGVPDMLSALQSGKIDAVCMEYALLYSYYSESTYVILPEAIDTVSYAFAFRPGSSNLAKVANAMLARMRSDGSLDALIAKWNLTDYS